MNFNLKMTSSPFFFFFLLFLLSFSAQLGICADIPDSWRAKAERGDMLVSSVLPENAAYVPQIGNGYVAAIPVSDVMYVSGLFNGRSSVTPSHRAKVPFPLSVSVVNKDKGSSVYALDVREAAFYERLTVGGSAAQVEMRWYAPFQQTHAICLEISVTAAKDKDVVLELAAPNKTQSSDIDFSELAAQDIPAGTAGLCGTTKVREDPGDPSSQNSVVLVHSVVPRTVSVPASAGTLTFRYIAMVYTTLDTPKDSLVSEASRGYKLLVEQGDTLFSSRT